MYRPVCDTCNKIIYNEEDEDMIVVDKLVMTNYKTVEPLHFCSRACFLVFMENKV